MQWSAPKTGWLERNWIKAGVEYTRVEGSIVPDENRLPRTIGIGSVVDAVGRSRFCFQQIERILDFAQGGYLKDTDVILLDDFWTPGFEALPYAFHLLGIRPRIYAFLHAQSVDEFDFTHPMRSWMRPMEQGFANALDGIFVCCPTLKDLVCFGGIADRSKVHVTGHPFSSEEVMERMPGWYKQWMTPDSPLIPMFTGDERKNQVVWSSRFDAEKNPMFFLAVADTVLRETKDATFVVCTSAPKLRSNYPAALNELHTMVEKYPGRFVLREGLTKEEYYAILCESKIQFNCASQDFVAITLLEASVAGCYPIYPYFRSFPETFLYEPQFMYQHLNVEHAVINIQTILNTAYPFWTAESIKKRSWIHSRFDSSWLRMMHKMGIIVKTPHTESVTPWFRPMKEGAQRDPFVRGNWLK